MVLMTLREVCFAYGNNLLLDHVDLNINSRERICLIGRNGMGKTTLMKIIAGHTEPDAGKRWSPNDIHTSYLAQNIPLNLKGDAFQVICSGLGEVGEITSTYRKFEEKKSLKSSVTSMSVYEKLQNLFDTEEVWLVRNRVKSLISQMNIPDHIPVKNFSTGMQRKVLLARVIAAKPELLLLDEPTNHMDLEFISWLETFLVKFKKTLVFITHDRAMIKALATRIIEIDMGKLTSWDCTYETYLKRKEACLVAEEHKKLCFDKKLVAEETWIRQGIKARRTRNEGRIKELEKMRKISRQRQNKIGEPNVKINASDYGGKLIIEANNIVFSYKTKIFIKNLSCKIMKGDRIGIIGPNGCGKTTLIRLLLRKIAPTLGSVRHGVGLQIAYFDQSRMQIDGEKTARDNVFDGNDVFEIGGRTRHVIGYLRDFLFSPERSAVPAKFLSGGEKNRLLLAKLFTKPANLLVFDEPTNDLDLETLELLEELLIDYNGTILLVSHDRNFIDHVVTSLLVFKGSGEVDTFIGGCADWYYNYFNLESVSNEKTQPINKRKKTEFVTKNKISYMEKRELEALPNKIELLEKQQQDLFDEMSTSNFYKHQDSHIVSRKAELTKIEESLEVAYSRWEILESRV